MNEALLEPAAFRRRLQRDPVFSLEIEFCCDAGIPYSRFLGRVPQPPLWGLGGELLNPDEAAEWTPNDRALAIAWRQYDRERCGRCRIHPDDWSEFDPPYESDVTTCFGCQAIERELKEIPDEAHGARAVLVPISPARRAAALDEQ